MLGLAIAFAISALVNLALLISPRTRETLLSSRRWLIKKVQAFCATPNTNSTFPGPTRAEETPASNQPPQPPPPPPAPAVVWPTVRPSAPPPPPPRNIFYGAKGIFETGNYKTKKNCTQNSTHVAKSLAIILIALRAPLKFKLA